MHWIELFLNLKNIKQYLYTSGNNSNHQFINEQNDHKIPKFNFCPRVNSFSRNLKTKSIWVQLLARVHRTQSELKLKLSLNEPNDLNDEKMIWIMNKIIWIMSKIIWIVWIFRQLLKRRTHPNITSASLSATAHRW